MLLNVYVHPHDDAWGLCMFAMEVLDGPEEDLSEFGITGPMEYPLCRPISGQYATSTPVKLG